MVFGETLNQQVDKAIIENWPKIQDIFQKTVSEPALLAAKNDKTCEVLFLQVYKQLPLPIRLVVKKDLFVKFCFDNRDKLVSKT